MTKIKTKEGNMNMMKNKDEILKDAVLIGLNKKEIGNIEATINKIETLNLDNDEDLTQVFRLLDSGISSWNEDKHTIYDMILDGLPKEAKSKIFKINETYERTPEEIKKLDEEWKADDFDSWKELSPFSTL